MKAASLFGKFLFYLCCSSFLINFSLLLNATISLCLPACMPVDVQGFFFFNLPRCIYTVTFSSIARGILIKRASHAVSILCETRAIQQLLPTSKRRKLYRNKLYVLYLNAQIHLYNYIFIDSMWYHYHKVVPSRLLCEIHFQQIKEENFIETSCMYSIYFESVF